MWSASTGTKSDRKERSRRGSDGESGRDFRSVPVEGLYFVIKKHVFLRSYKCSQKYLFVYIQYQYIYIYVYDYIYICI